MIASPVGQGLWNLIHAVYTTMGGWDGDPFLAFSPSLPLKIQPDQGTRGGYK
jgi:hypothetical protein